MPDYALGSPEKALEIIDGADHNDIILVDLQHYFGSIQKFIHNTANG